MDHAHEALVEIQRQPLNNQGASHVYHNITVSEKATAIFGNVYTSCADVVEHFTRDEEYRTLAQALRYDGMYDRFQQIASAAPETCSWIWSTVFDPWIKQSEHDDIFWITGKPGSGKSTLMKYLVNSKETSTRLPLDIQGRKWKVVYFFYNFRVDKHLANTEEGMLRSILAQILEALKQPEDQSIPEPSEGNINTIAREAPIEETASTIVKFLRLQKLNILLLVDGLDECGSNIRTMVGTLISIQHQTGIRLCLASRPEAVLKATLHNTKQIKMQELNHLGIEQYAKMTLDDISKTLNLSQLSASELLGEVTARADGVFLFVHFTFETIIERLVQGLTVTEIRLEIHQMPQELSSMYDRIFNRIPIICRAEIAFIFDAIENGPRVMSLNQLFYAWHFFKTRLESTCPQPVILTKDQFQVRLLGLLGSIIEVKNTTKDTGKEKVISHRTVEDGAVELEARTAGSAQSQLLLMANKLSAATNADTTVSFMHETVRNYIWQHEIIRKWSSRSHAESLSDSVWPSLHSEIIRDAEARLGHNVWDTLRDIARKAYVYWIPTSCQTPNFNEGRHGQLAFLVVMIEKFENRSLTSARLLDAFNYTMALFSALKDFSDYRFWFERASMVRDQLRSADHALRSPLILLHDLLGPIARTDTIELESICSEGRFWRNDLSFAAARYWTSYLTTKKEELAVLSSDEKDFLISCQLCRGTSVWDRADLHSATSGHDIGPIKNLKLIINAPYVDAKHLALLMTARKFNNPQKMDGPVPLALPSEYKMKSLEVQRNQRPREIYQRLEGKHLLQVWAEGKNSHKAAEHAFNSLKGLHALGANCATWRDSKNQNIVHCILDAYTALDPLAPTVFRLVAVRKLAANFFELNSTGESGIGRLRNILAQNIRMNDTYEQGKHIALRSPGSLTLAKSTDTVIFEWSRCLIDSLEREPHRRNIRVHEQPRADGNTSYLTEESQDELWGLAVSGISLGVAGLEEAIEEYLPQSSDTYKEVAPLTAAFGITRLSRNGSRWVNNQYPGEKTGNTKPRHSLLRWSRRMLSLAPSPGSSPKSDRKHLQRQQGSCNAARGIHVTDCEGHCL